MKKEIQLHGTFGYVNDSLPWFSGRSIASQIDYFDEQGVEHIQLRINSTGGFVSELLDIVNAIARSKAKVSTFVEGLAMSCGLFLALCGKERHATSYSTFTAHNPFTPVSDSSESEKQMLEAHRISIIEMVKGAGIDTTLLEDLMNKNTTFTAKQAKEFGFIDRIVTIDFTAEGDDKEKMMAFSKFAVMGYVNNSNTQNMEAEKELGLLLAVVGATDTKQAIASHTDLKNQVQALVSENALLKTEVEAIKKNRVMGMVDKAIEEKRIDPAQRESVMAYCISTGEDKAAGFLAGLKPQIVNLSTDNQPNPAGKGDKKEDDFDFDKYLEEKIK